MGKIRHLAIRTEDTGKLASFYMEVFELKELHKERREGGAVFLTDGYFNLAILPNDSQNSPNGLYHFGIEVDDADKVIEKLKKLNISKLPKPRDKAPFAETRASDPDGNYFDISEHGFLDLKPPEEKEGS